MSEPLRSRPRLRLAVLGNSDSHAYHDSLWFAVGTSERGGSYREVTLQWTEVLGRTRDAEVDQGPWGRHGWSRRKARVLGWLGIRLRTPIKQDYAYNYAIAGARCADLHGPEGQSTLLVAAMDNDREGWRDGLAVIRIGINDVGKRPFLDTVAGGGLSQEARDRVAECTSAILLASRRIRDAHPSVKVVLVGIDDNLSWPPYFESFRSADAIRNVNALNDAFDDALRTFARSTTGVYFYEERAWFRRHWGGRGPAGETQYRSVDVGGVDVNNTAGDDLGHAVLLDGHAGTLVNALWVKDFTRFLSEDVGVGISPVSAIELAELVTQLRATMP